MNSPMMFITTYIIVSFFRNTVSYVTNITSFTYQEDVCPGVISKHLSKARFMFLNSFSFNSARLFLLALTRQIFHLREKKGPKEKTVKLRAYLKGGLFIAVEDGRNLQVKAFHFSAASVFIYIFHVAVVHASSSLNAVLLPPKTMYERFSATSVSARHDCPDVPSDVAL